MTATCATRANHDFMGRWGPYGAAVLLLGGALLALPLDLAVSHGANPRGLPSDIRKLVTLGEAFAHGWGAALILISAWVLDPPRRICLWRVATCAYGAGAVAQVSKLLIPRLRPNVLVSDATIWDSFLRHGDLAAEPYQRLSRIAVQSLPSGHAATAVGLALGLGWLYPQGRWWFLCLAGLAAFQRVFAQMHYLSDVLAGAAIGCLVAGMCLDARLGGRFFGRLENRSAR